MTCVCSDDIRALSKARGICKEKALLDFLTYFHEGYSYCSENQSFYKKIDNDMSILVAMPCKYGFGIEPYVSMLFEMDGEKINIYFDFDGNEKAETFFYDSGEFVAVMSYFKIALDFQQGKLVGFILDF